MGFKICAGKVSDLRQDSGDWLFVDVGFSSKGKTCGVLKGAGNPELRTFRGMVDLVLQEVQVTGQPLNLLLEAPLSAAFNQSRNPTGRSIESIDGKNRKNRKHRYWYEGPAGNLVVASGYLLRAMLDCEIQREVRLFEGFVSFKPSKTKSSHTKDVKRLRKAAWNPTPDCVFAPCKLRKNDSDTLQSVFKFADMNFGIPPVVVAHHK